jgi:hypothetical protein
MCCGLPDQRYLRWLAGRRSFNESRIAAGLGTSMDHQFSLNFRMIENASALAAAVSGFVPLGLLRVDHVLASRPLVSLTAALPTCTSSDAADRFITGVASSGRSFSLTATRSCPNGSAQVTIPEFTRREKKAGNSRPTFLPDLSPVYIWSHERQYSHEHHRYRMLGTHSHLCQPRQPQPS